jgi:hypothetical protein
MPRLSVGPAYCSNDIIVHVSAVKRMGMRNDDTFSIIAFFKDSFDFISFGIEIDFVFHTCASFSNGILKHFPDLVLTSYV